MMQSPMNRLHMRILISEIDVRHGGQMLKRLARRRDFIHREVCRFPGPSLLVSILPCVTDCIGKTPFQTGKI